jgi:hypothetical protein
MPDYRVKGAFFENVKDSGPAFTGFVEIDGTKTMIALWPKTSAAGANYLQVSEDKKKAAPSTPSARGGGSPFKPRQPAPQPSGGGHPGSDMDDDIPFSPEWRG